MREGRTGFTLIELLIVVVIIGILALAAIPLFENNSRDARRAEGERLLGAARDFCRAEYSKTNDPSSVAAGFTTQQGNGAFDGHYYDVDTFATSSSVGGMDAHVATDSGVDGTGTMDFAWASGKSSVSWS
ncbi:MAG: type II secretion system protein [Planctomycetota bacterium]